LLLLNALVHWHGIEIRLVKVGWALATRKVEGQKIGGKRSGHVTLKAAG